jgi:hypothetical protein
MAKMLPMPAPDPEQWLAQAAQLTYQEKVQCPSQIAERILLPLPLLQAVPEGTDARNFLLNLMTDPVYQLK